MSEAALGACRPEVAENTALKRAIATLLTEAGERFILPRFLNLSDAEIETKTSQTDFVTIADREAEEWLTPRLLSAMPGRVIGEEASAAAVLKQTDYSGYSWTVDPLDGTSNFVKGTPVFCSMVALLWNGQPVQSWIWQMLNKTLFYAALGGGASCITNTGETRLMLEERPLELDQMIGSGNTLGLAEPRKSQIQTRLRALPGRQFTGSSGIQACLIASGEADFLIHSCSTPWDHAPVDLLCREAGGYAAMLDDGAPFHASQHKAPYMAASSRAGWDRLCKSVWQDG